MKKIVLLIAILAIAKISYADDVIVFDKVTDNVKRHIKSVSPSQFDGRTDVVIFGSNDGGSLSIRNLVKAIGKNNLKHDNGTIREWTQNEKDLRQAQADADTLSSQIASVNSLDITIKDVFTAWLKVYNSKVPTQYRVTPLELKDQIKLDKGI